MNVKQRFLGFFILILSLALSGCGPGQFLGPTMTPTPSFTPTPTLTPTPTATPSFAADAASRYRRSATLRTSFGLDPTGPAIAAATADDPWSHRPRVPERVPGMSKGNQPNRRRTTDRTPLPIEPQIVPAACTVCDLACAAR